MHGETTGIVFLRNCGCAVIKPQAMAQTESRRSSLSAAGFRGLSAFPVSLPAGKRVYPGSRENAWVKPKMVGNKDGAAD